MEISTPLIVPRVMLLQWEAKNIYTLIQTMECRRRKKCKLLKRKRKTLQNIKKKREKLQR
jgi:hypothetical protein